MAHMCPNQGGNKKDISLRVLHFLLTLSLSIMFLFFPIIVRADIGPKAQMYFKLDYRVEGVSLVGAQLLECEDAECTNGIPLEEYGPQGFSCSNEKPECSATAYNFAPYHKLIIEFNDRIRESQVFKKKAFHETYVVAVTESDLQVESIKQDNLFEWQAFIVLFLLLPFQVISRSIKALPALGLTLVIEGVISYMYSLLYKLPKGIVVLALCATLLSFPFVWVAFPVFSWLFPRFTLSDWLITGLSEVFAIALETGFIFWVGRKKWSPLEISFKHVAVMSLLMNLVSFVVGLML